MTPCADALQVEIMIEDARWSDALDLRAISARASAAVFDALMLEPGEFALLACADAHIAELNADFRGKPVPTNVLSWPEADLSATTPGGLPQPPSPDFTGEMALGDIAIAFETCAAEAIAGGKSLHDHTAHLIVHGLLHLLGYDHVHDADATIMEGLEIRILETLGLDDPYTETGGA